MAHEKALFEMLMRLADDHLILGHRLSEWCGHAPMLEEDLSMPNMALDLIGQARVLYTYAGEVEGRGRDEDALAYLRSDREYRNLLLVEQPNGDFAHTMLRQFYFAVFMNAFWQATLGSTDHQIAGIAGKAQKEMAYHVRHAGEWIIRLGDGTEESQSRMQAAVDTLQVYVDEMFAADPVSTELAGAGVIPDPAGLRTQFDLQVRLIFDEARLQVPDESWPLSGGRQGHHGEELGFLLAELQYMQRTYPGMTW